MIPPYRKPTVTCSSLFPVLSRPLFKRRCSCRMAEADHHTCHISRDNKCADFVWANSLARHLPGATASTEMFHCGPVRKTGGELSDPGPQRRHLGLKPERCLSTACESSKPRVRRKEFAIFSCLRWPLPQADTSHVLERRQKKSRGVAKAHQWGDCKPSRLARRVPGSSQPAAGISGARDIPHQKGRGSCGHLGCA